MKSTPLSFFAAAGLAVVLLSSCSSETGIKALDRAATAEDALPAFVTVAEPANPETARLLASHENIRYFILESDDSRTACLAIIPPGESPDWQVGCSENRGPGKIVELGKAGEATGILLGDGSDTGKIDTGWTQITDNILIPSP